VAYSNIRSALATRLDAITGVENVHSYHRHITKGTEDPAFLALYADSSNNLNAWSIVRTGCTQAQHTGLESDAVIKRTHSITITAYRSVVDASATENTLQDLVETVMSNFNSGDDTLGGVALTHGLMQLTGFTHAMFYNVLCHVATLTIQIEENA
jgi:hypothetical protein